MKITIILILLTANLTLSDKFSCRIYSKDKKAKLVPNYNFQIQNLNQDTDVKIYNNFPIDLNQNIKLGEPKKDPLEWFGLENYIEEKSCSQYADSNEDKKKLITRAVFMKENKEWFLIFFHLKDEAVECKDSINKSYLFWRSFKREIKESNDEKVIYRELPYWSFGVKLRSQKNP